MINLKIRCLLILKYPYTFFQVRNLREIIEIYGQYIDHKKNKSVNKKQNS